MHKRGKSRSGKNKFSTFFFFRKMPELTNNTVSQKKQSSTLPKHATSHAFQKLTWCYSAQRTDVHLQIMHTDNICMPDSIYLKGSNKSYSVVSYGTFHIFAK